MRQNPYRTLTGRISFMRMRNSSIATPLRPIIEHALVQQVPDLQQRFMEILYSIRMLPTISRFRDWS